jgi:putative sigma-54 modulation protein
MDKLDRQVVRHKDKLQDHHHATHKRSDAAGESV